MRLTLLRRKHAQPVRRRLHTRILHHRHQRRCNRNRNRQRRLLYFRRYPRCFICHDGIRFQPTFQSVNRYHRHVYEMRCLTSNDGAAFMQWGLWCESRPKSNHHGDDRCRPYPVRTAAARNNIYVMFQDVARVSEKWRETGPPPTHPVESEHSQ